MQADIDAGTLNYLLNGKQVQKQGGEPILFHFSANSPLYFTVTLYTGSLTILRSQ